MTTHLHLAPGFTIYKLYLHSPIHIQRTRRESVTSDLLLQSDMFTMHYNVMLMYTVYYVLLVQFSNWCHRIIKEGLYFHIT